MDWFAIPFRLLISSMYISLDQVGESTESPFEGGANDVSMAQVCRLLEIELRPDAGGDGRARFAEAREQHHPVA